MSHTVKFNVRNQTTHSLKLTVNECNPLNHGEWTRNPPNTIASESEGTWEAHSARGLLGLTEEALDGIVKYFSEDGQYEFYFNNTSSGVNNYNVHVSEPRVQEDCSCEGDIGKCEGRDSRLIVSVRLYYDNNL